MSTTLHDHPPHTLAERIEPRDDLRRPSAFDRLALRLGLLLITYGRRRYALTREQQAHRRLNEQARAERERAWERTRHLLPTR